MRFVALSFSDQGDNDLDRQTLWGSSHCLFMIKAMMTCIQILTLLLDYFVQCSKISIQLQINNITQSDKFKNRIEKSYKQREYRYLLIHSYMTAHFSGFEQTLQWKVAGLNLVFRAEISTLSEIMSFKCFPHVSKILLWYLQTLLTYNFVSSVVVKNLALCIKCLIL